MNSPLDRVSIVHNNFRERVANRDFPRGNPPVGPLGASVAASIFRTAVLTRVIDRQSRKMQAAGQGYYTIGPSGHEAMAAVAAAIRPTDPAFLHYRDAAFQLQRAEQVPGQTRTWDMMLSYACSMDDPISGGRHKVLGSKALNIPPQTSTIASHLPKAVGAAYSIGLARRQPPEHKSIVDDSLILCSFGDASVNHSTAQGAFNAAQWTSYQSVSLPLLFVCEDNGIGISTKTPIGWIKATFESRPALKYFSCDGLDIYETFKVASEAAEYVRKRRKPAFLHIRMIRLYGHAGPDVALSYLSRSEVEQEEAQDPLLHIVRQLDEAGVISPDTALQIYDSTAERVERVTAEVIRRPRLETADQIMASLVPLSRKCSSGQKITEQLRAGIFGSDIAAMDKPQPMVKLINMALTDIMLSYQEVVLMGQDIAVKGGNYGVTQRLSSRFGRARVIDTLLDEQSIIGLAIGMAQNGFVPLPEIQFLAYLHNAEDQLRGEAATLSFFSNGQFTNPMVVRISALGYQKGFGGHFHNDNSIAVLRDIPGLILACPSNGSDAARMLRECVRLAREEQRLVVFLEPIALYTMRDLHVAGDGGWMHVYPNPADRIAFGDVGVLGCGTDIAIITFGNGVYLSCQALPLLESKGVSARIIDIRWLTPLPEQAIADAVEGCASALIVDETRRTGGIAEALMATLTERTKIPHKRLTAEDSFIPTGPAYGATLPSRDSIVNAALALVGEGA